MNKTYGEWTVLKEAEPVPCPTGRRRRAFVCKCSCGKEVLVLRQNLVARMSLGCRDCRRGGRPKKKKQ